MDHQNALGNFGAPFALDWQGKRYTLSYRVQRHMAEFVRWAKERDRRELAEYRGLYPPEEYALRLDELRERAKGDFYDFNGPHCEALRATAEGVLAMVRILLGKNGEALSDADLAALWAEKGEEITFYIGSVQARVADLHRAAGFRQEPETGAWEGGDPKVLARELSRAGLL